MSIGILVSVHDGLVLAADSASTLSIIRPGPVQTQPMQQTVNVYNNANKIANLLKGRPIGCVAFGSGSIGNASISTLLKDFRVRLYKKEEPGFNEETYKMQDVATSLSNFLRKRVAELKPSDAKPTIGIMVAGYSAGETLGEGWTVTIENGESRDPILLRAQGDVGINWGGEQESISRLVLGFSPALPQLLGSILKPPLPPNEMQRLTQALQNTLNAPLAFAPMPIQDAIDLAEWLVHTASMFSRFTPGPPSVGGPVESAAITKHEGFKWVRRKHYYQAELNPENSRPVSKETK
jgi:hypothetical protein